MSDLPAPSPNDRKKAWLNRHETAVDRLLHGLLLALPSIWLLGYLFPPINHDAASILDVCHRWLSGETLYLDIIDVQAPMVYVLYSIPEVLSRLTGLNAPTWLTICVMAAIALSFNLQIRALNLVDSARAPLTGALFPAMSMYLMAVMPLDMFGQREHLMLIACLPYAVLTAARAGGDRPPMGLAVSVAIFAGLTLGQKPHFVVIPTLIELFVLYRVGFRAALRDPVPWTILAIFVSEIAFAWFVTPHYFTTTLPFVFDAYTKIGDVTVWQLLTGRTMAPTIVVLALLTTAAFAWFGDLARIVALFAIGGILSAVVQDKGWGYHLLPAMAGTFLLGALVVTKTLDRFLPLDPHLHRVPVAMVTTAFMLLFYYEAALLDPPFGKQRDFANSVTGRMMELVEREAPNRKVLVLSPGIYPHYPMINYLGVRMTMRFQTMWALQGIYNKCEEMAPRYNAPDNMDATEMFVFRTVADDFAKQKPDLLIVDRIAGMPLCRADVFDYLEYFSRNPLFAKAFEKYEFYSSIDRYDVYRRKG